jgi:hypothetical protein
LAPNEGKASLQKFGFFQGGSVRCLWIPEESPAKRAPEQKRKNFPMEAEGLRVFIFPLLLCKGSGEYPQKHLSFPKTETPS